LPEKRYIPFKLDRTLAPHKEEIIWSNMGFSHQERLVRFTATTGFVITMIIFWAIPVAFVGTLSNVNYLTNKVHFLRFILSIPPVLLGVVTGLLPAVLLAILMALLPIVLRCTLRGVYNANLVMAKWGGVPTLSKVELFVQNTYFVFQVIQVFLVTALASSATSVVTKIIAKPGSATSLLATNLPKSNNFYISFLLLQGLSIAGGELLQIVGLILFYLLGKISDTTPRKLWRRWTILGGLGWGTLFPIYTNLAVITITYSIMSPLILVFAAGTFAILYFAYLYNCLYVYNNNIDTQGMIFPRAIWQTFTGLYIMEVCMTGLFGIQRATPQIVLMAVTIPITAIYQIYLQWQFHKRVIKEIDVEGTGGDFHHPSMTAEEPIVWIPEDPLGVSKEEVRDTEAAGVKISERGAKLENGKLTWTEDPPSS
jgi:calcium permeable stress-gated cation channel